MRSAAAICDLAAQVITWPEGDARSALKDEIWGRWGLTNCIGFIDGTHVRLANMPAMPKEIAATFYTYKKQYSLMVLAVCDSQSKFTYGCVGQNGRVSDARALQESDLATANNVYFNIKEYLLGDSGFASSTELVCIYARPPNGKLEPYQVRSCNHATPHSATSRALAVASRNCYPSTSGADIAGMVQHAGCYGPSQDRTGIWHAQGALAAVEEPGRASS